MSKVRILSLSGCQNTLLILRYNYLNRRQEEITAEKEEIDRQKKLLLKKRPSNNEGGGGRGKRTANAAAPTTPQPQPLHNGTDPPTFLKPDPLPSMTWQEYYEADEILKVTTWPIHLIIFL